MARTFSQRGWDRCRACFATVAYGRIGEDVNGKLVKGLKESVDLLEQQDGPVEFAVCAPLLKQCAESRALSEGTRLHAYVARGGRDRELFLGNLIVQMYGKCGNVESASLVFERIREPNIFSWTIMLAAYAQNGYLEVAASFFERMPEKNVVSWTTMVAAFAQNGYLQEAKYYFDTTPQKNVVSWNAMITAYAQNEQGWKALEIFRIMGIEGVRASSVTFIGVLDACASLSALTEGKFVHSCVIELGFQSELKVGNAIVHMYGKCRSLQDARMIFDRMPEKDVISWNSMTAAYACTGYLVDARALFNIAPERNVVSWNALIAAYAQHGYCQSSLELFKLMNLEGVKPNEITLAGALDACASLSGLAEGKLVHACAVDTGRVTDLMVGTAVVNMYGKCGEVQEARNAFDNMTVRDVVSCTALIAAYTENGFAKDALDLYCTMDLEGMELDNVSYLCVVDACATIGKLTEGRIVDSIGDNRFYSDVIITAALVNMYGKCNSVEEAQRVFDSILVLHLAVCNAMIAAYGQNGRHKEALGLFRKMVHEGIKPDKITFVTMVDTCTQLAAVGEGRIIHGYIVSEGLESELELCNALVNMHGRCGSLQNAKDLFDRMDYKNEVSYNGMITANAQNGHGTDALKVFQAMELEGIQPTKTTFVSIVSACSHAGLLHDCWHYFAYMNQDYEVMPTFDHYLCMIDHLGRVGQLNEAEELMNSMPWEADVVAWTSLLGACRSYGDVLRASRAAEQLSLLEPGNAVPYVLLSSM